MTEEKKSMVPKLRFPGFNETWEQRKFYDCFKLLRNNSLARAELAKIGKIRNIHYGDVLINYPEVLNISTATVPFIAESRVNSISKDSYLENGDIVIADTAEDESVGKTTEIQGITDHKIVSGLHTIPCRPLVNFSPNFLGFLLNSPSYHDQLKPLIQGIKVSSISKKALGETRVCFAKDLDEQAQIGGFFNGLEMLITLHQRKLEGLSKLKKSLLQKMFPKNGQQNPEVRFPGFTEAWEQRKLEDICDVRDGTHSSPKYFDNGFPLVTSKNLRDGVIDLSDVQLISKEDYLEINKRSKVDLNDILMSMIGTIGNLALIKEEPTFAIKNVALIKSTDKVKMDYLFSYLSSPSSKCDIDKSVEGGTQKFLSLTKVRGLKILLPGIEEQQKIGSFSVLLDGVITLHQRKLESLKILKKSLLQQMFV